MNKKEKKGQFTLLRKKKTREVHEGSTVLQKKCCKNEKNNLLFITKNIHENIFDILKNC